ncbi:hypothetical protein N752_12895 [Desulforamulus aquiferis]|nr:helicase-related protein [Desulforamulus aquiferis]RYD04817.1 hypothetical protein N752_12895 [Desulforamulus aquiferis]
MPLVEESEKIDTQAAIDLFDRLQKALANFSVGLLHGRMKAPEKEAIMGDFRMGKLDVLVSTTVIEVGVDVPNATVMVVWDARDLAWLNSISLGEGLAGEVNSPTAFW